MDAFAVFSLPPRAVLAEDDLKQRYLELTAAGVGDAGALNEAYRILSSDRLRLGHLLQLGGVTDLNRAGVFPAEYGELLSVGATVLKQSQSLLQKLDRAEHALARAELAVERVELIGRMQQINGWIAGWLVDLRQRLAATGPQGKAPEPAVLADFYARFSFLERWEQQVSEHLFRLAEWHA